MHEMSIANSILEAVRKEAATRGGVRVSKVGVRVGELAAVDPEALRFCFEAMVQGSDLEPLALEIEHCPRRHQCRKCGCTFAAEMEGLPCPECGGVDSFVAGGDELDIPYMEVENGAGTAGT